MRDLTLFRILAERAYTEPELAPLLAELARSSPRERVPYFGALVEILERGPRSLHALALGALTGADGYFSVRAFVRGLEAEPDPALAALARASEANPARWAHAIFHPNEGVRRAAVVRGAPEQARHLELHLVADDATRDVILARKIPAKKTDVVPLLEFARTGRLEPEQARALLEGADIAGWLTQSRARAPEVCAAYLASALRPEGPDGAILARADDDLDDLFGLFAPDPAAFRRLIKHAGEALFDDHSARVATALVKLFRAAPEPPLHLLEAAVRASLALVRCTWIERAARKEAALALYQDPAGPFGEDDEVLCLLFDPIAEHDDGGPDLAVCGAILSRLSYHYFDKARALFGRQNLAAAFGARPEDSAYFLFPTGSADEKLPYLELCPSTRARRRVLAAIAKRAPLDALVLLAECEPADVAHVLAELVPHPIAPARADALAAPLVRRIGAQGTADALSSWRGRPRAESEGDLARALLFASAREHEVDAWTAAFAKAGCLPFVLDLLDREPTFPYGKERALAELLLRAGNPAERAWAERRVVVPETPAAVGAYPTAREVATAKVEELGRVLAPLTKAGVTGIAGLLAARTDRTASVAATVALLASRDPLAESAAQLARYVKEEPSFVREVDLELVKRFGDGDGALSLFGHAWLWRWERHAERAASDMCTLHGSLAGALAAFRELPWTRGRADLFAAAARWLAITAARQPDRYAELASPMLVEALILALPREEGPWAADALVTIAREEATTEIARRRQTEVRLLLPELADETRARLDRFVSAAGLERRTPKVAPPKPPPETLAAIAASTDLDRLEELAAGDDGALATEAVLRLIDLGHEGAARLSTLLERTPSVPHLRPLAESIPLWDDIAALDRARSLVFDGERPRELRFRVAISFVERGERALGTTLHALVAEDTTDRFFEPKDWDALVRLEGDASAVACALAPSPHPHAYLRAIGHLIAHGHGEECLAALRAFLDRGTARMGSLRRSAAAHLHLRGDTFGFPLVLEQELDAAAGTSTLLRGVSPRLVELATTAYLAAGNALAKEGSLLHHLAAPGVDPIAAEDATALILEGATADSIRQKAAARLKAGFGFGRFRKLHRVADTFAWGVRTGRELLGQSFRVQMTGGAALGHTRLNERRIFVSALPILRGEQHGREIVEGLILHEYGHHLYHKGKEEEAVWDQAEKAGLHGVLNLVADEHLERNLRAMDDAYGDRLKRLAAYAFQHTAREIEVEKVLSHLGGRAFEVLSKTGLGVARDPGSVVVESGELLAIMERSGMAFSRFVRALRMGLGNRHDDPRVERALELFRGTSFRKSSMARLWEITKELKEIFGWETQLVASFGPHESLETGGSEEIIWGEGITQEEIEREVERVLDPRNEGKNPGTHGKPGRPWINLAPKNDFDRIGAVEHLAYDPAEAQRLAARVRRPAALMRRFLEDLGMRLVAERMRLSGFRIDKARLKPLVLRGDPRALVARSRQTKSDLFLGIVVDCSGSMSTRDNMERARLFAALLAEAARGLPGVDFHAFGFTDRVIYDAGDANRCAAHALRAGGGNNDAGALFHAANVAKSSRRKSKLLVMISDGLPTECSVAALRELVATLGSRERIVCAQAAVQPLAEVCFPNYVVLNDASIEITVSKFGQVVARLVQRALSM